MPDEALAVHESDVGGVRLLEVSGDLDIATAPGLCTKLDAARAQRVRRLVVDLTGVDFCDSTGLRALMGASIELRHAGGRLAVVVLPDGGLARLFDVTGMREALPTHDTRDEAVASLAQLPT